MAGEYGLRLIPLHGGGLRFEVLSGDVSAATDMPFRKDVTNAVAAILAAAGITRAVFEDGRVTCAVFGAGALAAPEERP